MRFSLPSQMQAATMLVELSIFAGVRNVVMWRELYTTLGSAVRRQIVLEDAGCRVERRSLALPLAAPAA